MTDQTDGIKTLAAPTARVLIEAIREIVEHQKGPCSWRPNVHGSGGIEIYDENNKLIGQVYNPNN